MSQGCRISLNCYCSLLRLDEFDVSSATYFMFEHYVICAARNSFIMRSPHVGVRGAAECRGIQLSLHCDTVRRAEGRIRAFGVVFKCGVWWKFAIILCWISCRGLDCWWIGQDAWMATDLGDWGVLVDRSMRILSIQMIDHRSLPCIYSSRLTYSSPWGVGKYVLYCTQVSRPVLIAPRKCSWKSKLKKAICDLPMLPM